MSSWLCRCVLAFFFISSFLSPVLLRSELQDSQAALTQTAGLG